MYKPLIIFNKSIKSKPGLASLKREGWDIYNILSGYDAITLKSFAEEAHRVGADTLGVIVEDINDPVIDNIYETAKNVKVEILNTSRLYEVASPATGLPNTQAAPGPVAPGTANTPVANNMPTDNAALANAQNLGSSIEGNSQFNATKNHISLGFVIHMQQYTNLNKIKGLFSSFGKKTASTGILDEIQRANHNVDISKGDLGPIIGAIGTVQYMGKGKDEIRYEVKADGTGNLSSFLIDAKTRRETSLVDPVILHIQQSEFMAQGLSNKSYIDMVNAYCGDGTIAGVTSGNNSLLSELSLDSSSSFSISNNPIGRVSKKRDAFITLIYFLDPSSVLNVNYTAEDAEKDLVYYFNRNTTHPGLKKIATYIENVCKTHGLQLDNEATIKANNERIKQIVLKIKEEMVAGHKVHPYYDMSKSIAATAIWNASGIFASNCIWLSNIGLGSKLPVSDEEAADAADEAERQARIDKLKAKNSKASMKGGLVHDWLNAWGQMSNGYQGLADLTAPNGTAKSKGRYDDAIAEEEYYAELAKGKVGKTKLDNKLTAAFVCAPSFDDFASIMFPSWKEVKLSGVYSDTDPVRKNGQDQKSTDTGSSSENAKADSKNTEQGADKSTKDDVAKNASEASSSVRKSDIKVDPEHSKDSLFPTKNKDNEKSLF